MAVAFKVMLQEHVQRYRTFAMPILLVDMFVSMLTRPLLAG